MILNNQPNIKNHTYLQFTSASTQPKTKTKRSHHTGKMMKPIVLTAIVFGVITIGFCKNKNNVSSQKKPEETKPIKKPSLTIEYPDFSTISSSTAREREKMVLSVVKKIDANESKLKRENKYMTLDGIANTPVTIWYLHNTPIKIHMGVADDSGEISGVFKYYLKNRKIWYVNQIFARYLFDNGKLKYWMNKTWNVNRILDRDFKAREKSIKETVALLLSRMKK